MSSKSEVLLSSTIHDPRGIFIDSLPIAAREVYKNYRGWIINTTAATDDRIKQQINNLKDLGLYLSETDSENQIVTDPIENDHLFLLTKTLKLARNLGLRKVQYTDGDRIIVAAKYYPEDFREMALKADVLVSEKANYLNFRRSAEDYFTHHPPLVQTEFEFNRLYSKVFGMTLDIGSTAHVMSDDVLEIIIERSSTLEQVSFPHPKWLLIAKGMGAEIVSVETQNVLTFETPEQFIEEIRQKTTVEIEDLETNYPLVQKIYMATLGLNSTISVNEWELRFKTLRQYLELLKNHLDIFGFENTTEDLLRKEIHDSLLSSERREKVIIDALLSRHQ